MTISLKNNQISSAIQNSENVGIISQTSDPTPSANKGNIYSKEIDGYSELHYQDDYGLVTQITNKGNAIGGGGGGIALDTTYSSAFSGAKSVYDYSLNKLTLGYEDEFPGVALGSRWTTSLGSDGSVAVASNAVQITDGITGTDAVYAYIVAADNPGWEVTVHITNNGSATSTAGGLWVWDNLAVTRFAYIQLQGGTVWYGYGPATFNNTAVGASAQWFKLRYNGNAFTWFRHTNAHTSEPTIENWTFIATTSVTGYYLAPQQIRLQVDASGANVADYSFRHFRLRYL